MDSKTNVMRILDAHKIFYRHYSFDPDAAPTGLDVAHKLHQNPGQVYKTLLTVARSNKYYVFMIPVRAELDLKRAACAVGEKSVDMVRMRDLLPISGYVHGGCSPIGMKKLFTTVLDASAQNFDTIIYSAGRRGHQVETSVPDLQKIVPLKLADVCI